MEAAAREHEPGDAIGICGRDQVGRAEECPHQMIAADAVEEVGRLGALRNPGVHAVRVRATQHAVRPPHRVAGPARQEVVHRNVAPVGNAGAERHRLAQLRVRAALLSEREGLDPGPGAHRTRQKVARVHPARERDGHARRALAVRGQHIEQGPVEPSGQRPGVRRALLRESRRIPGPRIEPPAREAVGGPGLGAPDAVEEGGRPEAMAQGPQLREPVRIQLERAIECRPDALGLGGGDESRAGMP